MKFRYFIARNYFTKKIVPLVFIYLFINLISVIIQKNIYDIFKKTHSIPIISILMLILISHFIASKIYIQLADDYKFIKSQIDLGSYNKFLILDRIFINLTVFTIHIIPALFFRFYSSSEIIIGFLFIMTLALINYTKLNQQIDENSSKDYNLLDSKFLSYFKNETKALIMLFAAYILRYKKSQHLIQIGFNFLYIMLGILLTRLFKVDHPYLIFALPQALLILSLSHANTELFYSTRFYGHFKFLCLGFDIILGFFILIMNSVLIFLITKSFGSSLLLNTFEFKKTFLIFLGLILLQIYISLLKFKNLSSQFMISLSLVISFVFPLIIPYFCYRSLKELKGVNS